jgi:DNA-binding NarL/FixJ family response regulator
MRAERLRVVVADDHRIVREGLRLLLSGDPDIEIVGEVSDGLSLLELLENTETDVVLMDVRMPRMNGLQALEALRVAAPGARVLILSMYDDPAFVKRAIELGAAGYLLKNAGRDELLRALHTVAEGGAYIQGDITGPLVEQMTNGTRKPPLGSLTVLQVEILHFVADGLDNGQIASELQISEAAVKSHLRTIFSRLGVKRRSEAAVLAVRLGIIS